MIDYDLSLANTYLMLFVGFITVLSLIVLGIIASLRFSKGIAPLRTYESRELPGLPGPAGLIYRLDGTDSPQRELGKSRAPDVDEEGNISLPPHWEGKVTAGRFACVAYTWAMSALGKQSPDTAKARKLAIRRATMIPFFIGLVLLIAAIARVMLWQYAIPVFLACWAFFTFAALPTQFREWKAADLARQRLKEAGLWPMLATDAEAIDRCLKAQAWCNVAGFRRALPR